MHLVINNLVSNKMQLQEVSNKLRETKCNRKKGQTALFLTKCNRKKSQTNCGKPNASAGSPTQSVGEEMRRDLVFLL